MKARMKLLGEGGYNKVYVDDQYKFVFKVNKDNAKTDRPKRCVRLWNLINPGFPANEKKIRGLGKGWTCPYISGRQSTDAEMHIALIDIFNRSGRIIVDAVSTKNFITTDPPANKVVCIDIGMAMQMEEREGAYFDSALRRKSVVSLETWSNFQSSYDKYFAQCSEIAPQTVQTIKALLFIKSHRPDILNVDFLKNNDYLLRVLAKAYDTATSSAEALKRVDDAYMKQRAVDILNAQRVLAEKRQMTFETLQNSCIEQLGRYVLSRGNLVDEMFKASTTTYLFRKDKVITYKIAETQAAIKAIRAATSIEEIESIINARQKDSALVKSGSLIKSGIATRLGMCTLLIETARSENVKHEQAPMQQRASGLSGP